MRNISNNPKLHYQTHVFCGVNERPPEHPRSCCAARGSIMLRNYMKSRVRALGIKGIRVNNSGCLERCELGPTMVIYPEGVWYRYTQKKDIDEIIQTMTYPPSIFVSDKGGEFEIRNVYFSSVIDKYHMAMYYAKGSTKNAIVERWNRTIKTKMWRYFSANNTKRYIDILDSLIKKYNNTYHRSIGRTPVDARKPSSY